MTALPRTEPNPHGANTAFAPTVYLTHRRRDRHAIVRYWSVAPHGNLASQHEWGITTMVIEKFLLLATVVGATTVSGCCDQSGCEATAGPVGATSISEGIAGAGAAPSDVCDVCCECGKADFALVVIASDGPINDEADAHALVSSDAEREQVEMVDGRYEVAVGPGNYLVCIPLGDEQICGAAVVRAEEVTSAHVVSSIGLPRLTVFDKDGTEQPRQEFRVSQALVAP